MSSEGPELRRGSDSSESNTSPLHTLAEPEAEEQPEVFDEEPVVGTAPSVDLQKEPRGLKQDFR